MKKADGRRRNPPNAECGMGQNADCRKAELGTQLSGRSHNHLGCNRLRKCLTFPVRLWEDVRCNAGIVVTEPGESRGKNAAWSGVQPRKASGDVPPATARAGTSRRHVLTSIRRVKCSLMFAYVRLCSLNWEKMFEAGGIAENGPVSNFSL
jgi:hypothetical protein